MRLPLSVSSFAVKGNQEAAPFTVINRATVLVTREDGPASAQRDVSTPPIQISLRVTERASRANLILPVT